MNPYQSLINRVKRCDRIAALRLAKEIPLLATRSSRLSLVVPEKEENGKWFPSQMDVTSAFLWERTRQGHRYWHDVADKLWWEQQQQRKEREGLWM